MTTIPRIGWRVRDATVEDMPALARTLAAAFRDDPVMRWTLPASRGRSDKVIRYFELMITHLFLPRGRVLMTEDATGAVLWAPRGSWPITPINASAFAADMRDLFGDRADLLQAGGDVMDEHHPVEPHHYIAGIGVDPDRWSRGMGTSLLRPITAMADAEGVDCYLEASSLRNVALYERLGFRVRREIALPEGPSLYLMRRPPVNN
jgi:ribosomal protein S18 acetylase RimI-like enzyme